MDEISLNVGDSVCIYRASPERAEGHNVTQDTFGYFPTNAIKSSSNGNYQPLSNKEIEIKRQETLLRNSDAESEAAMCNFQLEQQSHVDMDSGVYNIICEMIKQQSIFIQQLRYLTLRIIEPLLSTSWFGQSYYDLMHSIIDIYKFHESLKHGLESISHGSKVGELLLGYSKNFKEIYSKYASLLPMAVTMSSRELNEFLRSRIEFCPSDSAVFLKFISLLHGPFHRRKDICISLSKLLQMIPVEHPDHQSVLDCWKSFKITASIIRELFCRSESEEELYAVESQLVDYQGPSLDDFGLIVLKAPFNIKYGRRRKYRFVYLLQKCILILRGKKSFFGNEKLTQNDIKMNSAESIYLDKIIHLDKKHYRAVASWEIYDKNAFRVFYVDEDGATRFMEFSAASRNEALKWIAEIRAMGDGNTPVRTMSKNMPSQRTSSLSSKLSNTSKIKDRTESIDTPSPVLKSKKSLDYPLPTPERSISLNRRPMIIKPAQLNPYLSPPSVGTKFEVRDITSSEFPSDLRINQKDNYFNSRKEELISRKNSAESGKEDSRSKSAQSATDSSKRVLQNVSSDHIDKVESFSGPRNLRSDFNEPSYQINDLIGVSGGQEFSFTPDFYSFGARDSFELGKYPREDTSDSLDILERMNSDKRISSGQFRSLYDSMQVKVQDYMDLKDRIDLITANVNKM